MSEKPETKKTPSRLYVVGKPGSVGPAFVRAISETQAKSHAASLDKYTARVAKPDDMVGVKAEDILDATKAAQS